MYVLFVNYNFLSLLFCSLFDSIHSLRFD